MIIYDKEQIVAWLTEISLRPCDFSRPEDFDDNMTEDLANGALELLETPMERRDDAYWVEDSSPGETIGAHWACSDCKVCFGEINKWNPMERRWRYCPSCGARMNGLKWE